VEIIDGSPCAASVTCYTGVETAVITKANLEAYFAASPLAGYKILRQMIIVLAQRLRQTNISYSSLMHVAEGVVEI